MHWDRQLYKALEHQYQMGLEALNENLPEIKVELVFRYSNKIYFLVVYMKKQRNMMFHYCPTFIIIIHVVCSFLCVWVISVEHVSVRNLFWIWMWSKTTKLIVYKKKLKLSLPSQIAKKKLHLHNLWFYLLPVPRNNKAVRNVYSMLLTDVRLWVESNAAFSYVVHVSF